MSAGKDCKHGYYEGMGCGICGEVVTALRARVAELEGGLADADELLIERKLRLKTWEKRWVERKAQLQAAEARVAELEEQVREQIEELAATQGDRDTEKTVNARHREHSNRWFETCKQRTREWRQERARAEKAEARVAELREDFQRESGRLIELADAVQKHLDFMWDAAPTSGPQIQSIRLLGDVLARIKLGMVYVPVEED